jgi:hypothetical protein
MAGSGCMLLTDHSSGVATQGTAMQVFLAMSDHRVSGIGWASQTWLNIAPPPVSGFAEPRDTCGDRMEERRGLYALWSLWAGMGTLVMSLLMNIDTIHFALPMPVSHFSFLTTQNMSKAYNLETDI